MKLLVCLKIRFYYILYDKYLIYIIAMRTETRINCNADESNRFYGNRGALRCLHEHGDVAIVELQYLKGNKLLNYILFFLF